MTFKKMVFKRVKLRELLYREKTLLKQLNNVKEWTPEMAQIANALTKLHGHLDNSVYEIPEDEWLELERLTY